MTVQEYIDCIRATLPSNKYVVAINIHNFRSVKRLLPFAREAVRQGHEVLSIATCDAENCSQLESLGPIFSMETAQVKRLVGLDVLFTQDGCMYAPLETKVVGLPHVFRPRLSESTDPKVYRAISPFMAASDFLILNQKNIFGFEGHDFEPLMARAPLGCQRPTESCTVISAGYTPIDELMEYDNLPEKCVKRSILFAPGMRGASTRESYDMIYDILEMLVSKYPDRNIIYSCFPETQDRVNARSLSKRFTQNNFYFNTGMTNLDMYADSAVAITDTSHTVQTFSFATLRPSIQCVFSGYRKTPIRYGISWLVHNLQQLSEILDKVLEPSCQMKEEMRELRDKFIVDPGHTSRSVIENLDVIVNGGVLPDWKVVSKSREFLGEIEKDPLRSLVEERKYSSDWDHQILLDQVTNQHPELDYAKEVGALISSARSFARNNDYDLICLYTHKGALHSLSPCRFSEFLEDPTEIPFYLQCSTDVDITDFLISKAVLEVRFAGYVHVCSQGEHDRSDGYASLTIDNVLDSGKDVAVLIAHHDFDMRAKAYLDMYYAAKNRDYPLALDGLADISMVWLAAYSFANSPRRLTSIELQDYYSDSDGKTYMIWGSGGRYRALRDRGKLPERQGLLGFIDNNVKMHGTEVDGCKVFSLAEALDMKPDVVILAMTKEFMVQVERQIKGMEED